MTDETTPESSGSLAAAMHKITSAPDSNPWCMEYVPDPVEEELWRQSVERERQARDKALDDRAMAVSLAIFKEAAGYYRDEEVCEAEFPFSKESLAAIIRPFLSET